jgi:general secretion pathway protein C
MPDMSITASLRDYQALSPQQWLERASQILPRVMLVILVVAIAWQLVQLTWLLLDRRPEAEPIAFVAPQPAPPGARRGIDVQTIVNSHLFGTPHVEATVDPASAPTTQMNLVLSAVFAAEDPAKGLAIIGESATSAKVYGVGAPVRPGTRLHAVYPDRVILDRGGQLEALALPKQSTTALNMPRPAPVQPSNQFANNLRRIAENNPTAFTEVVRPQPVFANGVQRGYRVYPGRNRQQFAKLGLQPGDLVLSINGTPLDDPQRGMEIFNTISTSDRVSVTVERNGQPQELTLNTAQITLPDSTPPPNAVPPDAVPDATNNPSIQ